MLFPRQHAFHACPNQACDQQENENHHFDEPKRAQSREGYRERQQKNRFHVEDQENDRVEVIFGPELNPGVTFRFQPTLVDGVFVPAGLFRRELFRPEPGKRERRDCESGCRNRQNENWQIIRHTCDSANSSRTNRTKRKTASQGMGRICADKANEDLSPDHFASGRFKPTDWAISSNSSSLTVSNFLPL